MRYRGNVSRTSRSGRSRARNEGYNTVNGYDLKNSWWALHAAVKERARGMCEAHGCRNHGNEVHHIVPLRSGGRNVMSNMIYLCRDCHDARHQHLFRARGR